MQEESIIAMAFIGVAFGTLPCSMNGLTIRTSQSSSKPHFILEIPILRAKVCVKMNCEEGNNTKTNCMQKEKHLTGLLYGAINMAPLHSSEVPGSVYLSGTQEQLLGLPECTRD